MEGTLSGEKASSVIPPVPRLGDCQVGILVQRKVVCPEAVPSLAASIY